MSKLVHVSPINTLFRHITGSLSHKPSVMDKKTLPAWGLNRQWWSRQHRLLGPQTGSVSQGNTVGLSHKPEVLFDRTLPPWATNRQCWLNWTLSGGARNRTVTVSYHCISLPVTTNWQWCELHHCWFGCAGLKSGSERRFWTDSDVLVWGSALKCCCT
jgi:hypothetical protein